jgi:hypothetical protein
MMRVTGTYLERSDIFEDGLRSFLQLAVFTLEHCDGCVQVTNLTAKWSHTRQETLNILRKIHEFWSGLQSLLYNTQSSLNPWELWTQSHRRLSSGPAWQLVFGIYLVQILAKVGVPQLRRLLNFPIWWLGFVFSQSSSVSPTNSHSANCSAFINHPIIKGTQPSYWHHR